MLTWKVDPYIKMFSTYLEKDWCILHHKPRSRVTATYICSSTCSGYHRSAE